MRRVGLLLMAIALVATGCAGTKPISAAPAGETADVDISGRWDGTWSGYTMGVARTDEARAQFLQQGDKGSGRLVLATTTTAVSVPVPLRDAGLSGVRVVFEVSGDEVVVRHARGANPFTLDLKVEGDRMVGSIRDSDPVIRVALTRVKPPAPPAAAAPPPPPVAAAPPPPAPAPAPAAPEPPKAPETVAAAPTPPPAPPEPARPEAKEFAAVAEVKPIHFDFDKSAIRSDDATILDANAEWLKANPETLVLIEGHCDERGTAEYNLSLGERRARAVRDYLIANGVASDRISIVSLGAERKVCTEGTEECWSQNRRAEFLVKPR